jgi:hypothetical protein
MRASKQAGRVTLPHHALLALPAVLPCWLQDVHTQQVAHSTLPQVAAHCVIAGRPM